jgi:sugar lactone lactonase YvrE
MKILSARQRIVRMAFAWMTLCFYSTSFSQNLFVSDIGTLDFSANYDGGVVYQFTPDGNRKVYTSGYARPNSLAFDSNGTLYVGDHLRSIIYKVAPDGSKTPFASLANNTVAVDPAGNLFATGFHFSSPDTDVWKFGRDGTRSSFASGIRSPTDLIFDTSGNLFVRDNFFTETGPMTGFFDTRIYKFKPSGEQSEFVSGQSGGGIGLAVNTVGEVFLNQGGLEISKFTPSGERSTFAITTNSTLGLAIDDSGNVYTTRHETDSTTQGDIGFVYKFAPDGTQTTFASGLSYPDFVTVPPKPSLRIELAENESELILTWPTVRGNYSVQSSSDLSSSNWQAIPGETPGQRRVPRNSNTAFFRLGRE